MKKKFDKNKKDGGKTATTTTGNRKVYDDPLLDNLPDRFFNEEGELDLSRVTGEEAAGVFNKQLTSFGLPPLPIFRR